MTIWSRSRGGKCLMQRGNIKMKKCKNKTDEEPITHQKVYNLKEAEVINRDFPST